MTALLDIAGLSVHFGGLRAIDDVSFEVRENEILGLVGPNGAGKTTAFNAIYGMVSVTGGRIALRGRDITGSPPERLTGLGIARTFQNVRPFGELTVRQNIMVGAYSAGSCGVLSSAFRLPRHQRLERLAAERADHWLERLGLARYANLPATALPLGLQRVAEIARAMASEPALVLLDEPAAGLNAVEKQNLATILMQLATGSRCALLLIDHDMTLVMGLVHRVVVLDFGKKIADGKPADVAKDPAVIDAYFGA